MMTNKQKITLEWLCGTHVSFSFINTTDPETGTLNLLPCFQTLLTLCVILELHLLAFMGPLREDGSEANLLTNRDREEVLKMIWESSGIKELKQRVCNLSLDERAKRAVHIHQARDGNLKPVLDLYIDDFGGSSTARHTPEVASDDGNPAKEGKISQKSSDHREKLEKGNTEDMLPDSDGYIEISDGETDSESFDTPGVTDDRPWLAEFRYAPASWS
ncbi:hypothetical protein FMUND_13325 [Fusarium mundagurra]|uniref:Uncharacterized protein n=1 Tax=Fusarium mundagurra TaxID=1567541 RepID=A0A8H5XYS7_9HYPO|nr:hypothetical protein FMUND_13325 [Fusarium mundagurra]